MSIPSSSEFFGTNSFSSVRKFNVTDIRNRISGASYLSKFYFRLLPTIGITSKSKVKGIIEEQKMEDIFIYANNVTVPQRAIDGENYTYSNGYRVNFPTTTSYGDGTIGINVRMDESYQLYDMFIRWMDIIHNKKTGHLSFYDDYVCDIEIFQLSYTNTNFIALDNVLTDYNEFIDSLEKLSNKSEAGVSNYRRTRGGTNNYSRFVIRNCYPKTISSIEFSHESQEKVNCLVNFAYEGIDYDVSSAPKTEEKGTPLSRENNTTNVSQGQQNAGRTYISTDPTDQYTRNLSVDEQLALSYGGTGEERQVGPTSIPGMESIVNQWKLGQGNQMTDSFSSSDEREPSEFFENEEWNDEAVSTIRKLAHIANWADKDIQDSEALASLISTLPPDSIEAKVLSNPENLRALINASAIRNSTIHAQETGVNESVESFMNGESSDPIKQVQSDQRVPAIEFDENGRVSNMAEILNAHKNTIMDPDFGDHITYMDSIAMNNIQDAVEREVSTMAVEGVQLPPIFPPPKDSELSNEHKLANNIVKLEGRVLDVQKEINDIDTKLQNNREQIANIQSDIDALDTRVENHPGENDAIRDRLVTTQQGIRERNDALEEDKSDKIDKKGQLTDLINDNFILQNSTLRVDPDLRLQKNDQPVVERPPEKIEEKIKESGIEELPEEVTPTQSLAALATRLKAKEIAKDVNWYGIDGELGDLPQKSEPEEEVVDPLLDSYEGVEDPNQNEPYDPNQVNTNVMPEKLATAVDDFKWLTTSVEEETDVQLEGEEPDAEYAEKGPNITKDPNYNGPEEEVEYVPR